MVVSGDSNSLAVILFTGGADSSLAASLALEKHTGGVILLTFKNRYELFIKRSCLMAKRLQERHSPQLVIHKIIDNSCIFNLTVKDNMTPKKYLKNIGLLCLAERVGIYIQTVIFCLENKIRHIYDGSNYHQGNAAFPQTPEAITIIKEFFQNYSLFYGSPIYNYIDLSEVLLFRRGLMKRSELYQAKRLFFKEDSIILFDLILGLWHKASNKVHPIFFIETALQLWGRLTGFKNYSEEIRQKHELKAQVYLREKLGFAKEYIKSYFIKKDQDKFPALNTGSALCQKC